MCNDATPMSKRAAIAVALVVVGCSSSAAPPVAAPVAAPAASSGTRVDPVPMSDPHEYAIDRISRSAGAAIFERTGIGDPYMTGIPYPVFLALLEAYPDTFGRTTAELAARFGFVARAADPASPDLDVREGLPIGMHLTTDPITTVPFVVTNCALCHAERIRWPGGEATVIGLGNKRVQVHAYDRAFARIAEDAGRRGAQLSRLAATAAQARNIAWPEATREAIVGATVRALASRASERAELHAKTVADPPGRVAVIESFAFTLEKLTGRDIPFAPDVGWAKVPDVIGYRDRLTLSWDAAQEGPIDLLVVEADIAAGVRVDWIERHPFQGASLGAYLRQPAARPPYPGAIDRRRATRGRTVFEDSCADCHGRYGADGRPIAYDETVIAIGDLGTDPARLVAPTAEFERVANDPQLTRGYTRFKRSDGYVPPILTNVWARAPYGHAAQWPSLEVLATPPARRPTRFVVDLDALYDLRAIGVPHRAPGGDLGRGAYVHDATKPGFSVAGHPFLADLEATDRAAVIEYLKTL